MAGLIEAKGELDDYKIILYNHLFTYELNFPTLHIELEEDYFIIHILPDNLSVSHLIAVDEAFDRFDLVFLPNSQENLMRLKFILKGD